MLKQCLLGVGWATACAVAYGGIASIEVQWNLVHWRPMLDGYVVATFLLLIAALTFQSRVAMNPSGHSLGLTVWIWVTALGLLAAGVYLFPAEPVAEGFLGRPAPSPLWYRASRCVVLAWPILVLLRTGAKRPMGGPKP